jgi:hypothetical protein
MGTNEVPRSQNAAIGHFLRGQWVSGSYNPRL